MNFAIRGLKNRPQDNYHLHYGTKIAENGQIGQLMHVVNITCEYQLLIKKNVAKISILAKL
jgi:hypothetical protein